MQLERWHYDPEFAQVKKCFYLWMETRIDPYGWVLPCYYIDQPMGNIKMQELQDIWNCGSYRDLRKQISNGLLPMCYKCCKLSRQWQNLLFHEITKTFIALAPVRIQPLHNGHVELLLNLSKRFKRVIVLIEPEFGGRDNPFSLTERLEMVKAVSCRFNLDNVIACSILEAEVKIDKFLATDFFASRDGNARKIREMIMGGCKILEELVLPEILRIIKRRFC